jgi:hypothetical protein
MSYTRRPRALAASVASFAVATLTASSAAAQPVRIDFAEFRRAETTEYQATPGGDVTSKGFDFYAAFGTGARNALQTWGTNDGELSNNLPTNLGPTAAALHATQFGERIDMQQSQGRLFQLFSIDVAHMYSRSNLLSGDLSPITLFFYGFNAAGANDRSVSFNIPLPPSSAATGARSCSRCSSRPRGPGCRRSPGSRARVRRPPPRGRRSRTSSRTSSRKSCRSPAPTHSSRRASRACWSSRGVAGSPETARRTQQPEPQNGGRRHLAPPPVLRPGC